MRRKLATVEFRPIYNTMYRHKVPESNDLQNQTISA